ncbi:FtsX-like permease family protein [Streptacidiphilus jiangxiensis]|uniref:FtsX-like permease family protein n=1 Tax=Streptacidiphilus jiangxiensis TaxID=235985 RepID=A0A1H7V1F6_STRJI|nr:FtsX-like permease family protein [Streptacidiphilus jiangxiensis]SEM03081.1 FtsX-like permease family protein [Streptacidiphilus jiangxiensis]
MTAATTWFRDLRLGARFAVSGREGWFRTLLTAFGVGCAVALLMLATALPGMMNARNTRGAERDLSYYGGPLAASATTLLVRDANTTFHGDDVHGEQVKPEGARVPTPPGLPAWPADGTMYVSPALRALLASPEGSLLKQRLPFRDVGTVGDAGLVGPSELAYYAGDATLAAPADGSHAPDGTYRTNSIGGRAVTDGLSPILMLLTVITFVVLLVPVGVFLATAVRIGGERRDRRLAALRLVGVDIRGTHRVAAGEALVGAVLGVLSGFGIFLLARQFVASVDLLGLSVFPSDIAPNAALVGWITLVVPLLAVAVTTLSLRGVTIEPLGVMRGGAPLRRRLWWRLLAPAVGAALLLSMRLGSDFTGSAQRQLVAGVVLLLVGVTMLLPWVMERVVGRLGGGPVPVQLGSRRLQLSGGTAARAVSGVAVAVAGAIAVQSLFSASSGQFTVDTGRDLTRAQAGINGSVIDAAQGAAVVSKLRATSGVLGATSLLSDYTVAVPGSDQQLTILVGDCATLVEYASITDCTDSAVGGAWLVNNPPAGDPSDVQQPPLRPGERVDLHGTDLGSQHRLRPDYWRIPATLRTAAPRRGPDGMPRTGLFVTPATLAPQRLGETFLTSAISLSSSDPDAVERARTTVSLAAPGLTVDSYTTTTTDRKFANIQRGLMVGAIVTLLLIAIGMAVSTTEQLRERKRLLAVLVAFGTKRSTLALSVLWQSAVPVVIGLALALVGGLGLGALLMRTTSSAVHFDWGVVATMLGAGLAAVAVATLLSLPALWRLMRADGLRTE